VPDTPEHSVSVAGIVVRDDGRILAVRRRDNQHWEPPGGVLELDETFEHGVRREVSEETGIEVRVERLTGVYKNMPPAAPLPVARGRLSLADSGSHRSGLIVEGLPEERAPCTPVDA
jgi:ADP-ribose pyrophosphatase YjhB (NUDIX family)